VFDATNTTRERRSIIISFAKEKGYKAGAAGFYIYSTVCFIKVSLYTHLTNPNPNVQCDDLLDVTSK